MQKSWREGRLARQNRSWLGFVVRGLCYCDKPRYNEVFLEVALRGVQQRRFATIGCNSGVCNPRETHGFDPVPGVARLSFSGRTKARRNEAMTQ